MKRYKILTLIGLLTIAQFSWGVASAEAGPLLDWLRGIRNRCSLKGQQPTYPMAGNVASNCGLQPGQCQVNCQQTCSRTVVNYVPYTAYRTSWEKVPVTQYRPVTSSDPATGCTVTCMKPCTSYTWSQKQTPYTTYRPVYRQETYKVPVSYITQDCNTCNVPQTSVSTNAIYAPNNACSTCNIAPSNPIYGSELPPVVGPSATMMAPNGTLGTTGSYTTVPSGSYLNPIGPSSGSPTPADIPPSLEGINPQLLNRPIIEGIHSSSWNTQSAPPTYFQSTQAAPVRDDWNYSPVRLASYTEEASQTTTVNGRSGTVTESKPERREFQGSFLPSPAKIQPTQPERQNSDWSTKTW